MRSRSTADIVRQLLRYGFTQAEIADVTERSKGTIAYHARRAGRPPDERFNRRYDWAAVQRFCDGTDNRLENLQLLCPNCHSRTDTFAGRNRALTRGSPEAFHSPGSAIGSASGEAPPMYPEGLVGAPLNEIGGGA